MATAFRILSVAGNGTELAVHSFRLPRHIRLFRQAFRTTVAKCGPTAQSKRSLVSVVDCREALYNLCVCACVCVPVSAGPFASSEPRLRLSPVPLVVVLFPCRRGGLSGHSPTCIYGRSGSIVDGQSLDCAVLEHVLKVWKGATGRHTKRKPYQPACRPFSLGVQT